MLRAEGQKNVSHSGAEWGHWPGDPQEGHPALRVRWRVLCPSLRCELGWGAAKPASRIQEVEFLTSGAELGAVKPQPGTQGALSSTAHWWHPLTRSAASPGTWQWEGRAGGGTQTSPLCPSHFRQHRNRSTGPAGRKPSADPKGEFQNFLYRFCALLFSKYVWELALLWKGTFRRRVKSAPERSEIKGLFLRSRLHSCFLSRLLSS